MSASSKVIITFVLMFTCINVFTQTSIVEPSQDPKATFRLFRTANTWNFLELNTITGQLWQVQFDIENDNRGTEVLSLSNLAKGKAQIPGRFTLFPTLNIYTFILLDQIDGITWQVQWSFEEKNRFVLLISE